MDCAGAAAKSGRVVLFIGNECQDPRPWTPSDFANAARFARSLGVDTIAPKRWNGNQKWYGTAANLQAERDAVLAVGCGYLPFGYSYGPAFGGAQYQVEADTIKEVCAINDGLCCIDMEAEWNGHAAEAATFASLLQGAGTLWCSTWADPNEQDYQGVVDALKPVITVWGPQQYTNFLLGTEHEFTDLGVSCIHPNINLSNGFDSGYDPLEAAKTVIERGHQSIWLWELQYAQQNPALVHQIVSLFSSSPQPAPGPVVPPPPPPPQGWQHYTVQSGDNLYDIAQFLKLGNWFSDLYQPNQNEIEAAARAHGYGSSEQGKWIFPGEVLQYRR